MTISTIKELREAKRFKVKETYLVTGWSYLYAKNLEDAQRMVDEGENYGVLDDLNGDDCEFEHRKTFPETLQEAKPKQGIRDSADLLTSFAVGEILHENSFHQHDHQSHNSDGAIKNKIGSSDSYI